MHAWNAVVRSHPNSCVSTQCCPSRGCALVSCLLCLCTSYIAHVKRARINFRMHRPRDRRNEHGEKALLYGVSNRDTAPAKSLMIISVTLCRALVCDREGLNPRLTPIHTVALTAILCSHGGVRRVAVGEMMKRAPHSTELTERHYPACIIRGSLLLFSGLRRLDAN